MGKKTINCWEPVKHTDNNGQDRWGMNQYFKKGIWKKWNYTGQLISECTYLHGIKHGLAKKWTYSGELIEAGVYKMGLREGYFIINYGPGKHVRDEPLVVEKLEFDLMKEFGFMELGEKEELEKIKEWEGRGVGKFKDGKQEGRWIYYHPPQRWDKEKFYQLTGIFLEPTSEDLVYVEKLYQAARTNDVRPHINSVFNNPKVTHFICGQVESVGKYRQGFMEGCWKYIDRNSNCINQSIFKNGIKI